MNWKEMLWFFALVIVVALIPPKYDPAIRLKEWNEKKRLERENKK